MPIEIESTTPVDPPLDVLDTFAQAALAGIMLAACVTNGGSPDAKQAATAAYDVARAMLRERRKWL
jgi:hypothetical protein